MPEPRLVEAAPLPITLIRANQIQLSDVFAFTGNNTHSGTETFTGALNASGTSTFTGLLACKNFEQIQCVDSTLSRGGSDIGAEINLAYAALQLSGSGATTSSQYIIFVAPKTDGSCYSYSTGISFSTVGKPALLYMPGVCLTWTPTSGTAITLDWGGNHKTKVGIEGGELRGPGSGSTAVGIAIGVTNGAEGAIISGTRIGTQLANGFLTDVNYANTVSFASTIEKSFILAGGTGVNYANGNESNRIVDSVVAQNATGINIATTGTDLKVRGTSIDDNTTVGVSVTNGDFVCNDCHFENINGGTSQYVTVSGGSAALFGGTMVDDVASGTQAQFISMSGLSYLTIWGTKINTLGRTITQAVNFAGTSRGILSFIVGSANITNDFNTAYSGGSVLDWPLLGTQAFHTANFSNYAVSINSTNGFLSNPRIQGSGSGTQAVLLQPGAGTNAYALILNNPGSSRNLSISDPGGNVNLQFRTGGTTTGDGAQFDANGNLVDTGSAAAGLFTKVNITPVTTSGGSVTTDQNAMAITITAGALNSVSRTLLIQLAGVYSTPAASTATLTHKIKLCTVSGCGSGTVLTLASWTSSALGGVQATNNPYNVTINSSTQTAGAAAAFEVHGNLTIDVSALASAAEAVFADNNTATVGTIDSTAQLFLQHTVAFSAASASNLATDRQMIADTVD